MLNYWLNWVEMINIKNALEWALNQLDKQNPDSRLDAELLLCHVLKKNRAHLYAHPKAPIQEQHYQLYQSLISLRAQGQPIAYLTEFREFWSLPLKVNQHTLIPRHETELLVELALKLLPKQQPLNILDLGTGSGAIALALAKERPLWNITACDNSLKALEVAKDNALSLGIINIQWIYSDWFNNLPQQTYHAIVSNPPYIDPSDPHLLEGDVRFEPINALISGQEGLSDLQYIIEKASHYLYPRGLLLLEHGYDQKIKLSTILNRLGYIKVQCWQDIHGHDRVSGGWCPELTR